MKKLASRAVTVAVAVTLALGLFAAPAARADDNEAKAKALYKSGVGHYQKGDYKAAIKDLKAADDLVQSPALAFNIAQAYRQTGDCKDALAWYRIYLDRDPLAKNKDVVNEHIANMLKCLPRNEEPLPPVAVPPPETKPATVTPPIPTTTTPAPTPAPTPPPPAVKPAPPPAAVLPPPPEPSEGPTAPIPPPREPVDENRGHGKKVAGLAIMGAGVAVTAVGIVFGLAAKSNADDVSSLSHGGGTWTPEFADKQSAGQRDEKIGAVGITLGVAAIVGGGVLYYLGATEKPEASPVAVGIGAHGGNVVFSWQY